MALDLNDTDIRKEVDDLIAKAVAEATKGLASNRDEILSEKKALQQKLEGLAGVTPDEYQQLKHYREQAEQKKLADQGQYEKALEESEKRNREAVEKMESALGQRDSHIKRMELQRALLAANVRDEPLLEAAEALFAPQIKLAEVEGRTIAQLDGKPVADYVSSWAETDRGKFFVSAPTNRGGGTKPGLHAPGNGQLYRDEMTSADKSMWLKANPDKTLDDLPLSRPK